MNIPAPGREGGFTHVGAQTLYTAFSMGRTYDASGPPPCPCSKCGLMHGPWQGCPAPTQSASRPSGSQSPSPAKNGAPGPGLCPPMQTGDMTIPPMPQSTVPPLCSRTWQPELPVNPTSSLLALPSSPCATCYTWAKCRSYGAVTLPQAGVYPFTIPHVLIAGLQRPYNWVVIHTM